MKEQIIEYVEKVWQPMLDAYYQKHFPKLVENNQTTKLSVSFGRKYAKVIGDNGAQRSVKGFIDMKTGDIFKPATWASPAKHARGNIADAEMRALTSDGFVRYL